MNPLTEIRDLVYQRRFTESLKLSLTCKPIGLPYIKGHSGKLSPIRKLIWLDYGWGSGDGPVGGDGLAGGYGYGYGLGDGWDYGWGDGYGDCTGNGWGSGDGYGLGEGWGYGSHSNCLWKRI